MPDFTRNYETFIAAPVHDVFEYCRDPRHLFAGWPELEVTDVVMTPEGVGTRAHIVGRFFKGIMVEQVERDSRRTLAETTFEAYLDAFPEDETIELPRSPVSAVASVKYYDEDGVLTTLDAAATAWAWEAL